MRLRIVLLRVRRHGWRASAAASAHRRVARVVRLLELLDVLLRLHLELLAPGDTAGSGAVAQRAAADAEGGVDCSLSLEARRGQETSGREGARQKERNAQRGSRAAAKVSSSCDKERESRIVGESAGWALRAESGNRHDTDCG
eukprot:715017-Pleurochrysis_carterae.AAC.3